MKEKSPSSLIVVLTAAVLLFSPASKAQDLLKEALASFPAGTVRLEYSCPAKLRTLPNYKILRQRFVGPGLKALEDSLSQLGIREEDIDTLVLAWQPRGRDLEMDGLAAGDFNSQTVAENASGRGLSPVLLAGMPVYCFGQEAAADCALVLRNDLGAFGSRSSVAAVLDSRGGRVPNLSSDQEFMKPLNEARSEAPIWGVAVGPAVADWFKGWMPNQGDLQMDWASTFQSVQVLMYHVETGEKVRLDVKLDCTTVEAAASLRQTLEGVKLFQRIAWQNQYPNRPNPFENLEVDVDSRTVHLQLVTDYEGLSAVGTPGAIPSGGD